MSSRREQTLSIETLSRPEVYGGDVEHVRLVETHISWVCLTGRYAYKIKKPLKLPFLDFSTLEQRRHFCKQELELNKRLAPKLYLEVVGIGGDPAAPRLRQQPTLEYAVKMVQFPDDARLDRRLAANAVPSRALLGFAESLARFHMDLPPLVAGSNGDDAAAAAIEDASSNVEELQAYLERDDPSARCIELFAAAKDWTRQQCVTIAPVLAERFITRRHREGHGDLHLENLILLDGKVLAFDALEFNPHLRRIDVMNESGFLAMDLLAHRRADAAYLFLNRYLEVTGDYDGLRVLRFYLVYRALVRAKVRAIAAAQHQTTAPRRDGSGNERSERDSARHAGAALYLELAAHLVRPRTPLLAIAHGLSGSGKTQISGELIGRLPALRVRSDLERKRLGGIEAGTRSGSAVGAGLYDSELTQRTYERLHDVARHALRNGFDVIVDAAFLRAARRREFRVLANAERAHFVILDCVAPEAVLRDRIDSRCAAGRDASEADQKVLDYQLQTHERTSADEQSAVVELDTARSIDYDELAARLAAPR